jgi:hypothetical protein
VGLIGAQTLVFGALEVIVVVDAIRVLDAGNSGVGWLNTALGIGGLPRRARRRRPRRPQAARRGLPHRAPPSSGISLMLLAATTSFGVALALFAAMGSAAR